MDILIISFNLCEKDSSLKSRVAIYGISLYVIGLVGGAFAIILASGFIVFPESIILYMILVELLIECRSVFEWFPFIQILVCSKILLTLL